LPATAIITDRRVQIMEIVPGSAAEKAGLKIGDKLGALEGDILFTDAESARKMFETRSAADQTIKLGIMRDKQSIDVEVKPEFIESLGRKGLGVALADTGTVRFPAWLAVGEGAALAARYTWLIVAGFGMLIKGLIFGGGPSAELAGPVGIAVMTGSIVEQGAWALAQFAAILSLNLAVINFLPIPALDGGRAVFVIADAFRKTKSDGRIEARVHQIGFIMLLILVLLVTLQDLRKFFFQ
jgi:regulator of sigma E protease